MAVLHWMVPVIFFFLLLHQNIYLALQIYAVLCLLIWAGSFSTYWKAGHITPVCKSD